jgi:hypothetical protein
MVKKLNLTAIILPLCVFFFVACAGGGALKEGGEAVAETAEDGYVWTALEFVSQLSGDWEGSSVIDVPAAELNGFPKTVFHADLLLSYTDRNVTQRITISFSKFLEDLLATHPSSGLTVDDLWERYFEKNYAGYTLIKEEYALVIETSFPVENLFNNKNDRLYINQDETHLRWLINSEPLNGLLEPFGITGYAEFILKKR